MYYVKELHIPRHPESGAIRCFKYLDRPLFFVEDLCRVFDVTAQQALRPCACGDQLYFTPEPGVPVNSSADASICTVTHMSLPDFSAASRKFHPANERNTGLYFKAIIFTPLDDTFMNDADWLPRDDAWNGFELKALQSQPAAQPTQSHRLLDWLHPDLRSRINEMLADDRFSYKAISAYLRRYGVRVSPSTVGRYARNTRSQYERCH